MEFRTTSAPVGRSLDRVVALVPVSAGASRPAGKPGPPWGIHPLPQRLASVSFVPLALSVLAQSDFEE
jgi:hypothetical protein